MDIYTILEKLNKMYIGQSISMRMREDGDIYIHILINGAWRCLQTFDTLEEFIEYLNEDVK